MYSLQLNFKWGAIFYSFFYTASLFCFLLLWARWFTASRAVSVSYLRSLYTGFYGQKTRTVTSCNLQVLQCMKWRYWREISVLLKRRLHPYLLSLFEWFCFTTKHACLHSYVLWMYLLQISRCSNATLDLWDYCQFEAVEPVGSHP